MMKYELDNFMRPFYGEIDVVIELGDGKETPPHMAKDIPVGIIGAKYYIDAHGTGHVVLVPACILKRDV